jgi:hypothetical protein
MTTIPIEQMNIFTMSEHFPLFFSLLNFGLIPESVQSPGSDRIFRQWRSIEEIKLDDNELLEIVGNCEIARSFWAPIFRSFNAKSCQRIQPI